MNLVLVELSLISLKVYTWGCNDEGALGRKTGEEDEYLPGLIERIGDVKVVQVSGGDSHTAALTSSGSVYCWGVFRVSETFLSFIP